MTSPLVPPASQGQPARRPGRYIAVGVVVYIFLGGLALINLPDMLLRDWFPILEEEDRAAFLGPAAQVVLFGLGGIIAAVGVGLSLARHAVELRAADLDRDRTELEKARSELQERAHAFEQLKEDHRRAETEVQRAADAERELRGRYVSGADLLTSSGAMKRTAGLLALAALGDDWLALGRRDETQTCVDVICGYLRSPVTIRDGESPEVEAAVRRGGFAILRAHLRADGSEGNVPWTGLSFSLRDAVIDFEVEMSDIVLDGRSHVDFCGAVIRGEGRLQAKRIILSENGSLLAENISVSGKGQLHLPNAKLMDNASLRLTGIGASESALVDVREMHVAGSGRVRLEGQFAADTRILLTKSVFQDSSRVEVSADLSDRSAVVANMISVQGQSVLDMASAKSAGESYIRLSQSGVEAGGQIWVEHATLFHDGLVYDDSSEENDEGLEIREHLALSDGKAAFGSDVVVRQVGMATYVSEAPVD